jgi:hypothetical protein
MDRYKLIITAAVLLSLAAGTAEAQGPPYFWSRSVSSTALKNAQYCPDTSVSANTITCSVLIGSAAYFTGMSVIVKVANTVTGATTINVNGLGSKAVTKNGATALANNDLLTGSVVLLTYDGTEFVGYIVTASGGTCTSLGGDITGTCAATVASVFPRASTASTPSLQWTGAWFTGGSSATTTPHVLIAQSGTAGSWNTGGTALGISSATGFAGSYIDLQLNGISNFSIVQTDSAHTSMSITGTSQGQMIAKSGGCSIEFDAQGVAVTNILSAVCGNLQINNAINSAIQFNTNNIQRWEIQNSGNLLTNGAGSDVLDIGLSSGNRPNHIYSAHLAGSGTTCVQSDNNGLLGNAATACGTVNQTIRAIGATFDGGGSALSVGAVVYFTVPYACTIAAWDMTVDTGTATVDVWKIATGTAIPTVTNTIVASAAPAISTGTAIHSTTLTGWTTAVTANDIFAYEIKAVSSSTRISLVLQCTAS